MDQKVKVNNTYVDEKLMQTILALGQRRKRINTNRHYKQCL
ncbi:hypothetical protein ACQQ2T_07735 [Paraclostridium tenue]